MEQIKIELSCDNNEQVIESPTFKEVAIKLLEDFSINPEVIESRFKWKYKEDDLDKRNASPKQFVGELKAYSEKFIRYKQQWYEEESKAKNILISILSGETITKEQYNISKDFLMSIDFRNHCDQFFKKHISGTLEQFKDISPHNIRLCLLNKATSLIVEGIASNTTSPEIISK